MRNNGKHAILWISWDITSAHSLVDILVDYDHWDTINDKGIFCAIYAQKWFMEQHFFNGHTNSLLLLFAAAIQDCVINSIFFVIENATKICSIIYIHKTPTNNIRLKIRVLITVSIFFCIN